MQIAYIKFSSSVACTFTFYNTICFLFCLKGLELLFLFTAIAILFIELCGVLEQTNYITKLKFDGFQSRLHEMLP